MIVSVLYNDTGMIRYLDIDSYDPNLDGYIQLESGDTIIWINKDKVLSFQVEQEEVEEDYYGDQYETGVVN
jgi:hypothetical protein